MRFWVRKWRVPRENFEFDSSVGEATDLIELHTDIKNDNSESSSGRVLQGLVGVWFVESRFLDRH